MRDWCSLQEVLSSASVALELAGGEGNAKALFRRCKANLALQNFKDASSDLECVGCTSLGPAGVRFTCCGWRA